MMCVLLLFLKTLLGLVLLLKNVKEEKYRNIDKQKRKGKNKNRTNKAKKLIRFIRARVNKNNTKLGTTVYFSYVPFSSVLSYDR